MTSFLPPPIPEIPESSDEFSPSTPPNAPDFAPKKPNFVLQTMREAAIVFFASALLGSILNAAGLTFFLSSAANGEKLGEVMKRPALFLLLAVVIAPLWEELLFRGVGSLALRGIWRLRDWSFDARDNWFWILGTISSFLFSVAHGVGDKTLHLPLPQLLVGFFLWHVAMKRGLRYSILMHATYNFIPTILVFLMPLLTRAR